MLFAIANHVQGLIDIVCQLQLNFRKPLDFLLSFFPCVVTGPYELMESHCFKSHSFKIGPPPSAASTFVFLTIFGRTDFRISLSKVKFDPEADFDVRFAVARQNPHQIGKKQKFSSEIFAEKKLLASNIQTSEIV